MKKKHHIILIIAVTIVVAIVCLLVTCNKNSGRESDDALQEVDSIALLQTQIHSCSRINVLEYKVRKIVTHRDKSEIKGKVFGKDIDISLPVGERKVAIPILATIKTSVDMEKVEVVRSAEENGKIEVFLPQPDVAIIETHIDHEGVKQMVPLLRNNFTDEELLSYERLGRDEIQSEVKTEYILQQARKNSANLLIPIVERMGYKKEDIIITFRDKDIKIIRTTD